MSPCPLCRPKAGKQSDTQVCTSTAASLVSVAVTALGSERVIVVYSTDLQHPHADPDGYFDPACIDATLEANMRAVILGQGDCQSQQPSMDGAALGRVIRAPQLQPIRLVLLTSPGRRKEGPPVAEISFAACLTKPAPPRT